MWGVTGAARDCLARALEHAGEREQFGRPIAAFQLTQAKLTEMAVALTPRPAAGAAPRPPEGCRARCGRSRSASGSSTTSGPPSTIARTARTILGGEGVRAANAIMRHMANLEAVSTYEGTAEVHTLIIGSALTGHRAFA